MDTQDITKTEEYTVIDVSATTGWVLLKKDKNEQISSTHKCHFPEEPYIGMRIEMTLNGALVIDVKKVENGSEPFNQTTQ